MSSEKASDPFDDMTHWVGNMPKKSDKERETDEDSKKHSKDSQAD